jgi:hypothetical protein
MSNKTINWNKLYSVAAVAAFACAAIGWTFEKASTYAALPGRVSDHERRISALEEQGATNAVRLDDRLDRIDGDIRELSKRVDRLSGCYDGYRATNNGYAGR